MQSQPTAVDPTHESEAQVTSELGKIVTSRPGELSSQPATGAITETGKILDIGSFFTHWENIGTGILQTTDTPLFDLLGSAFYPFATYLGVPSVVRKTSNQRFWTGDIELMFTITAPSNAYGLYLLQAIPDYGISGSYCANSATADNIYSATQGLHAFVDITTSNSVIFKLPFYSRDLVETLPLDNNMWRLCLWCLSPIANAVGSNTIQATYNIYARMPDLALSVPYYQGKKGSGMETLTRGMETAKKFQKDKTISKTAGKIASMAGMAATIPMLAPFAAPVAAGAAAVMSFASALGFTRESAPEKPVKIHALSFSSLACVDGQDGSEVVALLQSNTVTIDPSVGGGDPEDEMAFGSLFPRWTIVAQFDWTQARDAGYTLFKLPVSPFYCANLLGVVYPTVAGFVGFPFRYWRGSMEYKLIIPSSVYHRGMLQVYWVPDEGSPLTDPTQVLLNEIFDIEAGSEYTFRVDWSQRFPALENAGFMTAANYDEAYSNGFLFFRVVSALQAVSTEAPVTCCLLARACDNMDFFLPRQMGSLILGVGANVPLSKIAQFQGKNVGDIDQDDEGESFTLVPNDTINFDKIGTATSGENVKSVRALVQKFSSIWRRFTGSPLPINAGLSHYWPPPFVYPTVLQTNLTGETTSTYWTWYGHYAALYACVRGSTRYKIYRNAGAISACQLVPILHREAADAVTFVNTMSGTLEGWTGDMFTGFQNTSNGGVEFTAPCYGRALWDSPVNFDWTQDGGATNRVDFLSSEQTGTQQGIIFAAGGPDTTLFRFRRVPPMKTAV